MTKAESDVNGLLQQASDQQRVVDAKEELEAIQKVAMAKKEDVSALSELATKFEETRKVNWWSYCTPGHHGCEVHASVINGYHVGSLVLHHSLM